MDQGYDVKIDVEGGVRQVEWYVVEEVWFSKAGGFYSLLRG
jgi:hypothetical protein